MTARRPKKKSSGIVLRPYRASDLEAMFALDQICFAAQFQFSRAAMRRFATARNALTLLAQAAEGALAGFVIVHLENDGGDDRGRLGYLVTLDVQPVLARTGIGMLLLREIEEATGVRGAAGMRLHVHVENTAAIAFYRANGYRYVAHVVNFYGVGVDAELYEKELPRFTAE